jgi:AbrB family looped-hinge helix DNA binding protein
MRPLGIVVVQVHGLSNNFRSTIPKDVVSEMGLKSTDKIIFYKSNDGEITIRRIERK